MSNNIEHCRVINMNATIFKEMALKIADDEADNLPEDCFLYNLEDWPGGKTLCQLKDLTWSGINSGHSFDKIFLTRIVPLIRGNARVVYIYESGEQEEIFIQDGEYTIFDPRKAPSKREISELLEEISDVIDYHRIGMETAIKLDAMLCRLGK